MEWDGDPTRGKYLPIIYARDERTRMSLPAESPLYKAVDDAVASHICGRVEYRKKYLVT